jgi:glycine/D-amino acid oxidase-like deaminating enzyme
MKITQHIRARRAASATVPPYGTVSYWLATAPARTRRMFTPKDRYDVAIVGGGFTGLWTAYHLLASSPGTSIAIFENQEVGYGASGRNGGFAMPLLHHSLHNLVREVGAEAAQMLHQSACTAVDQLCETIAALGIDCDLDRSGLLIVATNEQQERKVRRDLEAARAIGLTDIRALSRGELTSKVNSPTYRSGIEQDGCATLHPLKLVRGLAAWLESKGVHIFERCNVAELEATAGGVRLQTAGGAVTADKAVLALNAWSSAMTPVERDVMPVYSYIIATEPIGKSGWDAIGWGPRPLLPPHRG